MEPEDPGLEYMEQGQMQEGTSIHAAQLELLRRLPCTGLQMLSPAEMVVWCTEQPDLLSEHDQAQQALALLQLAQSLFVLAPVHADGPSHWTLLCAVRQQRDQPWQVQYYDSLYQQTSTCYQAASRAARRMFLLPADQELPVSPPGLQTDGWSCGLWTLRQMEIQMRSFRGELPTLHPSITQILHRVNDWIQKLHHATVPKAKAKAKAKALPPAPPPAHVPKTFEEALARGQACKKCRTSKTQLVKGCASCMGPWFEEIRQRKTSKDLGKKVVVVGVVVVAVVVVVSSRSRSSSSSSSSSSNCK